MKRLASLLALTLATGSCTDQSPSPTAMQVTALAAGTTYHVDCAAGDDANSGTSETAAWRTTTRANLQTYTPGDAILFKRGTTCSGTGFKPAGTGTVDAPITIADYGSGALPVLDGVGDHEPALMLHNVQDYVVKNLEFTQHGQVPSAFSKTNLQDVDMVAVVDIRGLAATSGVITCGEPCTTRNITLDGVKVHDGQWNGVYIAGGLYDLGNNWYGYVDNVVIQNSESWNNRKIGIDVTSTYTKQITYHATNIKVLDSYVHHNGWDGIRMGPVDHGLIDGNECSYNGQTENARLGCWGWDSHDLVIQFNVSHHNMTPLSDSHARDGGGFDCDLGSEDCLIQYNWSHDNEGEGFLLLTWPIGFGYQRGVSHNIQMRYNVGERDGKKLGGGITIFGGVDPAVVYNNTIYYEPNRPAGTDMFGGTGGALTSDSWGRSGQPNLKVYNNIFITNGTVTPSAVSNNAWSNGAGRFVFDNNLWWRVEGGVRFEWGSKVVTTWAGWQGLGFDLNGLNADPKIAGPPGGGPGAYVLTASSPAIDGGRAVTEALRGMGTRDYFGTATPQGAGGQGGRYDIGAVEFVGTPAPTVLR
jgi:hypothetical protein